MDREQTPPEAVKDREKSYRNILAATSIVGGATIVTILVGIIRTKALALLMGPAGIGMMGLLSNMSSLVASFAGLGLPFAAVQEIARQPDARGKSRIEDALWMATVPLAILSCIVSWIFRTPLAIMLTGNAQYETYVGLTGIAIALTMLSAVQQNVLQGHREVKALGVLRISSAILATVIAVPLAFAFDAITTALLVTIAIQLAGVVSGFLIRPFKFEARNASTSPVIWRQLIPIGVLVTVTGSLQMLALAIVRAIVTRNGGIDEAGVFQAVITIATMNATLILGSMAADYFPRLSESPDGERGLIVNQQIHTALLLAVPLMVTMTALSQLTLNILYSRSFGDGFMMLRWQLAGDLVKVISWALGFLLLARKNRRAFLINDLLFAASYCAFAYLAISHIGLQGVGVAYFIASLIYCISVATICARTHRFSIDTENIVLLVGGLGSIMLIIAASSYSQTLARNFGVVLGLIIAAVSLRQLSQRAGLTLRGLRR